MPSLPPVLPSGGGPGPLTSSADYDAISRFGSAGNKVPAKRRWSRTLGRLPKPADPHLDQTPPAASEFRTTTLAHRDRLLVGETWHGRATC